MVERKNLVLDNILQTYLTQVMEADNISFASDELKLQYLGVLIMDMIKEINTLRVFSVFIEGLKINAEQVILVDGTNARIYSVSEADKLQKHYLSHEELMVNRLAL